jgi:hypothetical protein
MQQLLYLQMLNLQMLNSVGRTWPQVAVTGAKGCCQHKIQQKQQQSPVCLPAAVTAKLTAVHHLLR